MKVGITLPNLGPQATRDNILQTAIQAEKEGFDSVWTITRILWPLRSQTPYPGSPDGSLPTEYQTAFDPLDVLTYVAANTSKISLGTCVVDMFFYTPVMLAKRYVTLDILSQGRVIAGLGLGWSKDEYQVSNIPFKDRGKRADEFIQALKRIWTNDVVEFKGMFYNIPASKIGPKPIQKPHIPIYLGGFGPHTYSRIVNSGSNGLLGVIVGPLDYLENTIMAIKDIANKANKDPNNFNVILLTYPNIVDSKSQLTNEAQRFPLTGTIDQAGNDIQRIKQMGIDHIIFGYMTIPIGRDLDKMLDITKQLSKFAR